MQCLENIKDFYPAWPSGMLRLNVYRCTLGDCTRGGVSATEHTLNAFTSVKEALVWQAEHPTHKPETTVILDVIGGCIRAFTLAKINKWQMAGGNVAFVCRNTNCR